MTYTLRRINRRIRSVRDMRHHVDKSRPAGQRSGKWHSARTLWAYWQGRKRANKQAAASRRQNRVGR